MGRKLKFRPEVTWIHLNPEQAVLSCNCYQYGSKWWIGTAYYSDGILRQVCYSAGKLWEPDNACITDVDLGAGTGRLQDGSNGVS